jgi:hypothetical protein
MNSLYVSFSNVSSTLDPSSTFFPLCSVTFPESVCIRKGVDLANNMEECTQWWEEDGERDILFYKGISKESKWKM